MEFVSPQTHDSAEVISADTNLQKLVLSLTFHQAEKAT